MKTGDQELMKTFEEILNNHLTYGKDTYDAGQRDNILSAMREACEQAIDECASKVDVCSVAETLEMKQSVLNVKKLLK